jgi:iron complex outermembrane receptor protein
MEIMFLSKFAKIIDLIFLAVFLFPFLTYAQDGGTIRGTITSDSTNVPLHNVQVQLVQLRRSVQSDDKGNYEFANVPAGNYTLLTHNEGFSDRTIPVKITSGVTFTQNVALSLASLREEVTVTATGQEQSVFESFQSVNAVGSTRIREQAATGIGDVLEREAGVGKRSFGPGTSRPIIRGFDGDRVLVTQDGLRLGSIGFQSGDHGEPVDTLTADRVEIVKGPATLLYGSNAVGGVVNVISNDDNDGHQGFRGLFTTLGNTVNQQGGVSGGLEYGRRNLLFSFNGSAVREGDYKTPLGKVPNSQSRYGNFDTSAGFYSKKGFLVGNYIFDKRRYGVPYAAFIEENGLPNNALNVLPEAGDEQVDLKTSRKNGRLRGGFRDIDSFVTSGNFAYSYTDYQHQEIETAGDVESTGTTFDNRVSYYRGTFEQKPLKKLTGRFGFEGFNRRYQTLGEEQLINGLVKHDSFSVFGLEEFSFAKRFAFQIGGRVEHNRYNPENNFLYTDRSFTGFSGSAGLRVNVWTGGSFVTTLTSAYRAPALEELYNNGAHPGNLTFEIGNQSLERERTNGVEFSLRQNYKRLRIDGSFFYYNISNFVFLAPQDVDADGFIDREESLPLAQYLQGNSRFVGGDITADFDFNQYFGLFFNADIVNAKLKDEDMPLPRITPPRVRAGFDFRYKGLSLRPEGVFVARRDENDIFTTETHTPGYSLFNVNASYTYTREHFAHIISVGAFNLTDRLYRNHLSFIKDIVPESGRGVRASYTFRFF